jgi:hypothetical protein
MHGSDPTKQPVPWKPPQGGSDIEHHTREWTSGTAGGGKVPADYEWGTNPKVEQEETGANVILDNLQNSSATKT